MKTKPLHSRQITVSNMLSLYGVSGPPPSLCHCHAHPSPPPNTLLWSPPVRATVHHDNTHLNNGGPGFQPDVRVIYKGILQAEFGPRPIFSNRGAGCKNLYLSTIKQSHLTAKQNILLTSILFFNLIILK